MATVQRRAIDAYAAALDMCEEAASDAVSSAILSYLSANPGASVAEAREFAKAAAYASVSRYGDAASAMACSLFDDICAAEDIDEAATEMAEAANAEAIDQTARYEAGKLAASDAVGFADGMAEMAGYHTRRAANRTMAANVSKSNGRLAYARVPRGATTCEWCLMLASRGFVYRSEESAAASSHRHCDCMLVPGVPGKTSVEGYDPDSLYRQWKNGEQQPKEQQNSQKIAGVSRGVPMTFEEADHRHANPKFPDYSALKDTYSPIVNDKSLSMEVRQAAYAEWAEKYKELQNLEAAGYRTNCQTCVVANEMRRRGYDVEALPKPKNGGAWLQRQIAKDNTLAWIDPETGGHPTRLTYEGEGKQDPSGRTIATQKRFWKWLNSENVVEPDGRYFLSHIWWKSGGAHTIILERTSKGIRLFDPQTGESFEGEAAQKYFDNVKFSIQYKRKVWAVAPELLRVDRLEPDYDAISTILKEAEA